jgi:tetratricopeptide (TPR) repeat protein
VRCPRCGWRLIGEPPACPAHGDAELPRLDDLESLDVERSIYPAFFGYRVVRALERGGFGTVYLAEESATGRRVAIKLARRDAPDAHRCLMQERECLARIGPPHVPALYAEGALADGAPYLVMEYLEERTLAARLAADNAPVTLPEACRIGVALLGALAVVHARGYVHCDLKPENLFVRADGSVVLVDFGLSMTRRRDEETPESSGEGGAGTAEYMSPEQCEGREDIDPRADLYSVGVILYELIGGRPPFWGPRATVRESHLSRRPPRLSVTPTGREVPSALASLVMRCLAKDRRDRFEHAGALAAAIEGALRELGAELGTEAQLGTGRPAEPLLKVPTVSPVVVKSQRVTVGLVFFVSTAHLMRLGEKMRALGGTIPYAVGERYVAVFGQDSAANPALRALRAAEEMVRLGLCERARIDLASVAVLPRRDGGTRYISALFARPERYPGPEETPGVHVSPAAGAVLPAGIASVAVWEPGAPSETSEAANEAERVPFEEPLFGRDAVLEALVVSARRAAAERLPTTAIVVGGAGEGKSHLFHMLVRRLRGVDEAEILDLRAIEPVLGDLEHPLRELLQRVLDLPASPPAEGAYALLRERLCSDAVSSRPPGPISAGASSGAIRAGLERVAMIALALGWLTDNPDLRSALAALRAAPGALRAALTVATADALRARAARRPLFILMDDAHVAGDVVLDALHLAADAAASAPIWVCAFGRPLLVATHPQWGERAAERYEHHLGALDAASAAAMCRRLLLPADNIPDRVVDRLVSRAEGVPLLLVELIRGLRREGIVRRSPKGESWYVAAEELDRLPDTPLIEWLAAGEMNALSPALRGHTRLLALLGDQVTRAEIKGVLRELELHADDATFPLDAGVGTQRLVAVGMAQAVGSDGVRFRHALVRETIARTIPEPERRRIHLAAVRYYRSKLTDLSEEQCLAQLAYHASEAGLAAVAARHYLDLAESARSRHAYLDAERLYSRVLEQPGGAQEAERATAYRGRGLMRYRTSRYHDALVDLSVARALAAAADDRTAELEILLDEANVLDWMDEYKTSGERLADAQALLPGGSTPPIDARLLLSEGRLAFRFSRNDDAAKMLDRAVALAERLGDDGYETLVGALMLQSFILPGLGRPEEARRAVDRAITLCEEHGDRLHLCGARNLRALLFANAGDSAGMVVEMERSLAVARELGQMSLELVGEFNLGEQLLLSDAAAAAAPHVHRALVLDRKVSGDPGRAVVALLEARLHLHLGDEAQAARIAAKLRARQAEAVARGEDDPLEGPSDSAMCTMIDLATRDADSAAWDALEAQCEQLSLGQERVEVIEARSIVCLRHGARDEARRHLDRALELVPHTGAILLHRLERLRVEIDRLS